jgi:cytochrome P450
VSVDPEVAGFANEPDYHDRLAALRRDDPVHRYRDRSWLVTRHEDVRAVSSDPARFRSGAGVLMDDPLRHGRPLPGSVLHMDPPEHGPWRALVARDLTPRAVAPLEARIRELARQVLDRVEPGVEVDAVAALAAPFPVLVIAELLGVADGHLDDFRRWSDACIEGADGAGGRDGLRSVLELVDFLGDHVDARRDPAAPAAADLVAKLANGTVEGCPVGRDDAVQYCLALLVAGNETTRHLLSGTLLGLAAEPEQRAVLAADPTLVPGAVEELLRWVTPIQAFGRTATRDTEIGGVAVGAGDWVVLSYASANRDESVFGPTAGRLDVRRPVPPSPVAFGFGEHLYLGASLARLEARVFLEELLARFPAWEVTGEPEWVRSTLVRGMRSLPVAFG